MTRQFLSRFWRSPHCRKWLVGVTVAFGVYLAAGFLLVPVVLKAQLLKKLPQATHRLASVREVKCNPLALSLTVNGLSLTETNAQPFVSIEQIYVNFQLSTLVRFAWTFDEVSLKQPRVELALGPDGRLSCADLFQPSTNSVVSSKKAGIPRLIVFTLSVTNGYAAFTDLSLPTAFRTLYEPIHFQLKRFETAPGREAPYSFEASSDSVRQVAWTGTITAQPIGSSGSLKVSGVQLPKIGPYLGRFTRGKVTDGALDVVAKYHFGVATNGMSLSISNLALTLTQVHFTDPETNQVIELPSVELQQGALDWESRRVQVGSVLVSRPGFHLQRRADGLLNLASLLSETDSKHPPLPAVEAGPTNAAAGIPWVFTLDDGQLVDASFQFDDAAVPGSFRSVLKPVTVRAQHVSTAPNAEMDVHIEMASEAAEVLSVKANATIYPLRTRGSLQLASLDLAKYQPYLTAWFKGVLPAGKAAVQLEFAQELRGQTRQASVTNASLTVSDLEIQSPDRSETVLTMPSFAIQNASGSVDEQEIRVGSVNSTGASVLVRREEDGRLNLLSLVNPPSGSTAVSTNADGRTNTARWRLAIEEVDLRDWKLHLIDRTIPKTGELSLDELALRLEGIRFPSNAPIAARISGRVNGSGAFQAQGTVWPGPLAATGQIEVAGLELRHVQPWTEPHVKLSIESGTLHAQGRAELGLPDQGDPKLHIAGAMEIVDLATVDQVAFKQFVGWRKLAVRGIDFGLSPRTVSIEQVTLSELKSSIHVATNKQLNFLTILPVRTNVPPSAPGIAPEAMAIDPATFILGELKFEKMAIHVGDQSVQPPCAIDLQQIGGTVRGLSTKSNSTADVDLTGNIDAGAPFALRGTINPLAKEMALDLALTNQNLQLTPFTPYLEKYAGHPLNRGRLSLDLKYAVEHQQLKARNVVRIDQLMLGPRNQSPDATKLPVKLAVALLKDSDGQINLDLPLEGRLDDPQFSVGPVIVKVIVNLIAKAVTSPFKLLGALVGGGEELSFVDFQPGLAEFSGAETNKLDRLLLALEKRPSLNLEIEASLDRVADRDALALALVQEQAKSRRLQELSAIGQMPPSSESFALDPADYERLLRLSLVDVCGTNLAEALRELAGRASAVTNSTASVPLPTRSPGLLQRAASWFKPRSERAATAQAHRSAQADLLLRKQNPELDRLASAEMELLLALRTEVPTDRLLGLARARAQAVQTHLLSSGRITADRLFLLAPKAPEEVQGGARVNLSLN